MKNNLPELQEAVERLHSCHAVLRSVATVIEISEGKTVWEGSVHVFDIRDHPEANTCYSWSSPVKDSTKRRYYAILKLPPVESPSDAVKASIVRAIEEGEIPIGSG